MMGAYCWEVHENLDSLGRWDRRRLAHGCLARLLPHLCETPLHRYEGIVSERVDRNWTQMRIEHSAPSARPCVHGGVRGAHALSHRLSR